MQVAIFSRIFFSWQEVYGCLKNRWPGPKKCQFEIFYYFRRKNAMGSWTRTFIRLRFLNSIQEPLSRRLGGWAYIEPVKPPTNNLETTPQTWTCFCVQKPLIRLGSRDDHRKKTRMYDVSPYNSKNFPLNGLKPPILLHCNLETIREGCCAWSGTQNLRCSQLVIRGEMKPKWISMNGKHAPR